MNYEKGQRVFFNHPSESWIVGKVDKIEENPRAKNKTKYWCVPEEKSIKDAAVFADDLLDLKGEALVAENEDLLEMDELHEATLLRCLENRYNKDVIYTFIGSLVVSFNPFKWTIPSYQDDQMVNYIQRKKTLPHAWSVADRAFRDMVEGNGNQTMLVSGESGAGKTEACKTVIKYLSELSCSMTTDEAIKTTASNIAQRIQESSPILEAFGNAKTKNNDNSSRFGKFIKLQFDRNGIILGADIVNYLLEKSRLIMQGPNERGYHVFYQLLAGATPEEKAKLKLTCPEDFVCVMKGQCTRIDGVDDEADYKHVRNAMNIVGMTEQEQEAIFRVVASILHLQNITFAGREDASVVENENVLATAAELLMIDKEGLRSALTTKTYTIMNKEYTSPLMPDKASDSRDALSKSLYDNMFNWIIWKINERICAKEYDRFIGLLDIFGFEMFEVNSFEQFCINFANESLQGHYNAYTFKRDKEECIAEGIDTKDVSFRDNQPCIDLIQGKFGILSMLDEQSNFPKATDMTFLEKLKKNFEKKHPFFHMDPRKREEFIIEHFAGKVEYNVSQWLEKNRDLLKPDLITLMSSSKCGFVSKLIPDQIDGKKLTVAGSFKKQLLDLLGVINSTNPHWIRCIKPHPAKKPNMFSRPNVMSQLRSSGVLETIRIRREGYSARILLQEFWKRYRILIDESTTNDYRASCVRIIEKVKFDKVKAQIGKTKVFLRSYAYAEIEQLKNLKLLKSIKTLQRFTRGWLARKRVWLIREDLRLKQEQIEYELYKEELLRLEREREERERVERERRAREEAERRRLEELRRIEEERLLREKEERDRIERERREMEEREKMKLEELRQRQADRLAELQKLELELKEKERREEEKMAEERRRVEEEIRLQELEEMERRREEIMLKERLRVEQEKEDRILARRKAFEKRQKDAEMAHQKSQLRKEEAVKRLEEETEIRRLRDTELQNLALLAQEKLEREKRAWEEEEWRKLEYELLIEEHRKEEKILYEREKIKRIKNAQENRKNSLAEKTRQLHEKMTRAERRKAIIHAEKEAFLQSEMEKKEDRRRELERRKQEQEVSLMEKQAQLQWEIDKEKRRIEMRAELKKKMQNEKVKELWRVAEIQKNTLQNREKDEKDQTVLEAELRREFDELRKSLYSGRDSIKSANQYRAGLVKKEQQDYEEQLIKLKKKISGVLSTSMGSGSSSPIRSRSSSPMAQNASISITRAAQGSPQPTRPTSAGSFSSSPSRSSRGSFIATPKAKPGSFSNLYRMP